MPAGNKKAHENGSFIASGAEERTRRGPCRPVSLRAVWCGFVPVPNERRRPPCRLVTSRVATFVSNRLARDGSKEERVTISPPSRGGPVDGDQSRGTLVSREACRHSVRAFWPDLRRDHLARRARWKRSWQLLRARCCGHGRDLFRGRRDPAAHLLWRCRLRDDAADGVALQRYRADRRRCPNRRELTCHCSPRHASRRRTAAGTTNGNREGR